MNGEPEYSQIDPNNRPPEYWKALEHLREKNLKNKK